MNIFANMLAMYSVDRLEIIDKTGLEGAYKIELTFSTDPFKYSAPDLKTALRTQLGLRLDARKGLVRHFILDHLERPTAN
jgi:uncharacterized protein (TIGR03435 family)